MKLRPLLLVAAVVAIAYKGLRCAYRGLHQPKRHPLGGFVCKECHAAGADLGEMGFPGSSEVPPVRRVYDGRGTVTRTEHWDESSRGGH